MFFIKDGFDVFFWVLPLGSLWESLGSLLVPSGRFWEVGGIILDSLASFWDALGVHSAARMPSG